MKKILISLLIACFCFGCSTSDNNQLDVVEDVLNSGQLPKGETKAEKTALKSAKKVAKKQIRTLKKRNQRFNRNLKRYENYLAVAEKYCSESDFRKHNCNNNLERADKMYIGFPQEFLNDSDVVFLREKQISLTELYEKQI